MSANSVPINGQTNDTFNQTVSQKEIHKTQQNLKQQSKCKSIVYKMVDPFPLFICSFHSKSSNVSVVRNRPLSSIANPFTDSDSTSNDSRMSPNPFNPFIAIPPINQTVAPLLTGATYPNNSSTPPPIPPPRPPSRDCPPTIPPRNDLNREPPKAATLEAAPPLPRRRTILPEHRYQSFDVIHRQPIDPFAPNPSTITNTFHNDFEASNYRYSEPMADTMPSGPPLPNPQRKIANNPPPGVPPPQPMARKLSSSSSQSSGKTVNQTMSSSTSWDPFECSFVEKHLSSIPMSGDYPQQRRCSSNANQFKTYPVSSDTQSSDTSTPKQSSDFVPNLRQCPERLRLSEIKSSPEWTTADSSFSADTPPDSDHQFGSSFGFSSDFSQFSEQKLTKHTLDLNLNSNSNENSVKFSANISEQNVLNKCLSVDSKDDHISPPERNIFIVKSDPFADDFFAE